MTAQQDNQAQRRADEAHLVCAFAERFLEDSEANGPRSLTAYLALYPGHEELIAREYVALTSSRGGTSNPDAEDAQRIGPYRLICELGRGGQAVVWLAEDSRLGRRVALKVLRGSGSGVDEELRRFRREASLAASLDDPGICPIYEVGHDEASWIAMRFLEGETLASLISVADGASRLRALRDGQHADDVGIISEPHAEEQSRGADRAAASLLPVDAVVAIGAAVARSLHVAHEAGIVHRDVKPGNIMVVRGGQPVILDFGIARSSDGPGADLTASEQRIGTPTYMAPEQVRGELVDRRTDIHALGVTLHELLTGERPFARPTVDSTYHAILKDNLPTVARSGREIPKDLQIVLQAATAKERNRRYATAEALAEDLQRVARREPILARRVGPLTRGWLWARRRPAAAGLLVALAVGVPVIAASLTYIATTRDDVIAREAALRELAIGDALAEGIHDFHHGDSGRGLALVRTTAEQAPDSVEAQVVYDWLLMETDSYQLAAERAAERGTSEADRILARLARARQVVDAPEPTMEADSKEARSPLGRFVLASAAIERGHATGQIADFEEAVGHLRAAVLTTRRPRLILLSEYAHALSHVGELGGGIDPREVRAVADSLVARWSDSFIAGYHAARLLALIDVDAAHQAYLRVTPNAPEAQLSEVRTNHARLLLRAARLEECLRLTNDLLALRLDRKDRVLFLGIRGRAHAKAGDDERAAKDLKEALELDPQRDATRLMLAQVLENQGKIAEAVREFARLAAEAPSALHIGMHARSLERAGRFDEAEREARRSIEMPMEATAGNREVRGHCLMLLDRAIVRGGRPEGDPALRERAIAFLPNLHELWHQRTIDLIVARESEQARAAARRAMMLAPDSEESRLLLGFTFLKTSKQDEGFELMGQAYASGKLTPELLSFGSERAAEAVYHQVRGFLREPRRPQEVIALVEGAIERFPSPDFVCKAAFFFLDIRGLGKVREGVDAILPVVPKVSRQYVSALIGATERVWASGEREAARALLSAVIDRMERDGARAETLGPLKERLTSWSKRSSADG